LGGFRAPRIWRRSLPSSAPANASNNGRYPSPRAMSSWLAMALPVRRIIIISGLGTVVHDASNDNRRLPRLTARTSSY
jgi:hypothetical protein